VNINARDTVSFDGVGSYLPSAALSNVQASGTGNAGNVNITAGALDVRNGALLESRTRGKGNAGSVNIYAGDTVTFDGEGIYGSSGAFSTVEESRAMGKGGDINITADSLKVTNGAQLESRTRGQGNAGSVNINASGSVTFDGVGIFHSAAYSTVEDTAVGKGGNINITTGSLDVTKGAGLIAHTAGRGDAGNVTINASGSVTFDGVSSNGWFSGAYSTVESRAMGKGGSVNIMAGSLSVKDGARLNTGTNGQGDAGSVIINARDTVSFDGVGFYSDGVNTYGLPSAALSNVEESGTGNAGGVSITAGSLKVTNSAQLESRTKGQGNAGSVNINASGSVTFDGVGSFGPSAASSSVEDTAVGKGGNINITTGSLDVTKGAGLFAFTAGRGDAGNVNINARAPVSFDGLGSRADSTVQSGAVGNGGGIEIKADSLFVTNGAILTASTAGQGNGGKITLNANTLEAVNGGQVLTTSSSSGKAGDITLKVLNSVTLSGSASGLRANTDANSTGSGGTISIDPNQLTLTNGANVSVDSQGTGKGGNIQVQAGSITLDNGALLSARANSGNGGNIVLNVQDLLLLLQHSQISASADTAKVGADVAGGNIEINTRFLAALPSENSDITATAFKGRGGNIKIANQGIFGIQRQAQNTPQSDITASSQLGINGNVQINTPVINPILGVVVLPTGLVDASRLIAQGCPA